MMTQRNDFVFKAFLWLFFILYFLQLIIDIEKIGGSSSRIPVGANIFIYIFFSIVYFLRYRRKNILCFELFALPIIFLGLFFDDIIYSSSDFSVFFSVNSETIKNKSEDIQLLAFIALLLGSSYGNNVKKELNEVWESKRINYSFLSYSLVGVIAFLIIYDYRNGLFSTWFYYSNSDWMDVTNRNQGLGHLTCFLLATTIIELTRLRDNGISSLGAFLRRVNKVYLFEWFGVSALLFISGNRNEMLLILLPLIVGYTVYIKKIPNSILILSVVAGVVLMGFVGMTRQNGEHFNWNQLGIVSLTRDFMDLGYNTDYLVEYTDKNGSTFFSMLPVMILSGIPYLGPTILNSFNYTGPTPSAVVCTNSVITNSGLGTSLIGDLYYTSGVLWVLVYMFILGFIMSKLYNFNKSMNPYLLLFYSYMVSNAIYYIRSSWDFPITIIENAIIILFIGQIIFKVR